MTPTKIKITIKSAATFGSGSGVAGLVDREIEHDTQGFPFLRGKTLKGLLAESAENMVFALEEIYKKSNKTATVNWRKIKDELFGIGGRGEKERGILHLGDAQFPAELRVAAQGWSKEDVLYSLTGIRRQTAINEDGGPDHATLRSMRVLLPDDDVELESPLHFDGQINDEHIQLLAAATLDLRRAGTGRNRGRGKIQLTLMEDKKEVSKDLFEAFEKLVEAI